MKTNAVSLKGLIIARFSYAKGHLWSYKLGSIKEIKNKVPLTIKLFVDFDKRIKKLHLHQAEQMVARSADFRLNTQISSCMHFSTSNRSLHLTHPAQGLVKHNSKFKPRLAPELHICGFPVRSGGTWRAVWKPPWIFCDSLKLELGFSRHRFGFNVKDITSAGFGLLEPGEHCCWRLPKSFLPAYLGNTSVVRDEQFYIKLRDKQGAAEIVLRSEGFQEAVPQANFNASKLKPAQRFDGFTIRRSTGLDNLKLILKRYFSGKTRLLLLHSFGLPGGSIRFDSISEAMTKN
jgi:hypothetical protein